MTRNTTLNTLLLAALLAGAACENTVVNRYESPASLYFYRGGSQVDSTSYSFFFAAPSAVEDTLWLDIRLTGIPAGEARPISLVQLNAGETNAARAGTHYVGLDDPRVAPALVLPASATSAVVPVILLRTPEMDTAAFRLALGIVPDDHFVEGIKDRASFVISITATAEKPAAWDRYYDTAFGPWGQEKMRFLIEHVGYTAFDESLANADMRVFLNLKAREKLAAYEAEHGPLYEADNITRVTFP
ncbi:MAG: DUF4843 domain-containing protein [Odoribacteraceae bacterium]|jgi:hypothetical protein|nr:DUF4843 domain-containing protein [Odoribacteraceae bacterium]